MWLFVVFLSGSSCTDYGMRPTEIDDELFLFTGSGGNAGVLVTDSVVLLIDTKMKTGAEQLSSWVNDHATGKKFIVVNTNIHHEHTGGNHNYKNATIIAGNYGNDFWNKVNTAEDMPTQWLNDTMILHVGEETVVIENIGQAHTFDDVIVYLESRKVLFTGDLVLNGYHPFFDEAAGADLSGYENAIAHMLSNFDVKTVVPGHGETGGRDVIVEFKQYLDDMKLAAENIDEEILMREKYEDYLSSPINKSGFDLTLDFIRKSESLRN